MVTYVSFTASVSSALTGSAGAGTSSFGASSLAASSLAGSSAAGAGAGAGYRCDQHRTMSMSNKVAYLLLLLGSLLLHFLLDFALFVFERSKKLGKETRALGTVLLLGSLLSLIDYDED